MADTSGSYERVTYRTEDGKSRTIYLSNPIVATAGELGELLIGVEVNAEGDEIHGKDFDQRRHVIAMDAIVRRVLMSRFDSMVSAEAWDDLVRQYEQAGGEGADDRTLAELLRQKIHETEG